MAGIDKSSIRETVGRILQDTQLVDVHTHVYDPELGPVLLWGIDELVTYHYLIAEVFRARPELDYDKFWAMSKQDQADLIWQELFVKRSPISEACRGVLTVMHALGLDPNASDLKGARSFFKEQTARGYVDKVFKLSGIKKVYMTNDPMDDMERPGWEKGFERDERFMGVLRLDPTFMEWPKSIGKLQAMGYDVEPALSGKTIAGIRKYINDWCDRLDARYMAISLPPTFRYPDKNSTMTTLVEKTLFPSAVERGIPVALMIGARRLVNPGLRLAGDAVGKVNIESIERLATDFADTRLLVTLLSRESMHELCVTSRKFKNITPFGCWWFLNNPSLIREITSMRFELLGLGFIPQHSDARVLDQLIYKWTHSRRIIADVMAEKYADMLDTGRLLTESDIKKDIDLMFDVTL